MWKITNTSKTTVKFAAAKSNTVTIGILLKPGEFCICDSKMTTSIDAQERRKFIEIDKSYDNALKLSLCENYSISALNDAIKDVDDYTKS